GGGQQGNQQGANSNQPEAIAPTKSQCQGLRKLLDREKNLGTMTASAISSVTYGLPYFRLHELDNRRDDNQYGRPSGNIWVNNVEIDIDWMMDLHGVRGPLPHGGVGTPLTYSAMKSIWARIGSMVGLEFTNPKPYQDKGETAAVAFVTLGVSYSMLFTEEWMKINCPEK
ncbi:MAG: hypothetical protein MN733_43405, partial [Nitrososphaera sp.]|nr:hypothetical protein [Nitrososphaera sp.]